LALLSSLDKFADAIRRHGGDFADYLEHRSDDGHLPKHFVKIRAGNEEFTHFFKAEEELAQFGKEMSIWDCSEVINRNTLKMKNPRTV
jgi:DNA gyrase subunit B